jgi:hypothetical protein
MTVSETRMLLVGQLAIQTLTLGILTAVDTSRYPNMAGLQACSVAGRTSQHEIPPAA